MNVPVRRARAVHVDVGGLKLLDHVRIRAVRRGGTRNEFPHVALGQQIKNSLLASAEEQIGVGNQNRARRAKIEIDAVEKALVARCKIVFERKDPIFELELNKAISV